MSMSKVSNEVVIPEDSRLRESSLTQAQQLPASCEKANENSHQG